MNSKVFAERFNRELALLDFPEDQIEKTKAVAKVFGVTRHCANAMIFGHQLPSEEQLKRIADELEVCPQWLSGHTEKRKAGARDQEASEKKKKVERAETID